MGNLKKIIFLNPPITLEERYGKLAKAGTQTPPLGLAILAAVLRKERYQVKIIDGPALGLSLEEVVEKVCEFQPKYIGITATVISINKAIELANRLKEKKKNFIIIIGGPQLTAMPVETLRNSPGFDVGVVGEGEISLIELLKALEKGEDLNNVKGLVIREGGEIRLTSPQGYIKDLDELPFPAWELLPQPIGKLYRPATFSMRREPAFSLITSRGCPSKCIFCDRAVFGNRVRGHSAKYIFEMIKRLYQDYGIREFAIADDTFNILKERLKQFCSLIIESDLEISWSCNARVDFVDEESLRLMRASGCWQIGYGLESGDQTILDIIRKGTIIEEMRQALRLTHKYKIRTKGYFMIGNPLETEKTILNTWQFIKDSGIDDFQLTYFTPLPGSEVWQYASRYGIFEPDFHRLNYWQPQFIPYGLTKERLEGYYRFLYRKFYFRPKTVFSYLRLINSARQIFRLIRAGFNLFKLSQKWT